MNCIERCAGGAYLRGGKINKAEAPDPVSREKTMAYRIFRAHEGSSSSGSEKKDSKLHITFDALISHDITYVSIIQTARASGLEKFPVPYVMTNCHNSLCAVGGTINEDDHAFGLSAAKKYGGIYVPANQAVIHQFAREKLAGCGKMILGSDSHTRYGCFGTMGVGEGGGEIVKQLLRNTWDAEPPQVVLIWVEGKVPHGIGPHDAALALVKETFPDGFVKNKILEFCGPGIAGLSMDFRAGIDVMTTETGCLSSIWITDDVVQKFYENIGRPEEYRPLSPDDGAYYDSVITMDLGKLESMIALPFHPSNAFTVHELQADPERILRETEESCNRSLKGAELKLMNCLGADGKIRCDQGVIVGCAGGMYENIAEAAAILHGKSVGNGYFDLSVYPSSMPVNLAVMKDGYAETLLEAGTVMKPCFCGPCFGAGDTPANNTLSIRHSTRNFANREGSRPANGQIAAVALMDARSIAATAANGGVLTAATDIDYDFEPAEYIYRDPMYEKRCYFGFGKADPSVELRFGPNITDWPEMPVPEKDLLVRLCAVIDDAVTTTDELIPSGETSSYRSNPRALAEFALSRRVPEYAGLSKAVRALEENREKGEVGEELQAALDAFGADPSVTSVGSCIYANRPGDGSAREQAASCQKVLGGFANICREYATKRYRSNCINWGIFPFTTQDDVSSLAEGDWVYIPDLVSGVLAGNEVFSAKFLSGGVIRELELRISGLSAEEKQILADGCLMNYYAAALK